MSEQKAELSPRWNGVCPGCGDEDANVEFGHDDGVEEEATCEACGTTWKLVARVEQIRTPGMEALECVHKGLNPTDRLWAVEHEGGFAFKRHPNGGPVSPAPMPRVVTHHSPTGWEWGYGGSGPADLALNILTLMFPPESDGYDGFALMQGRTSATAWELHQLFKDKFIATLPREGGVIWSTAILTWLKTDKQVQRVLGKLVKQMEG